MKEQASSRFQFLATDRQAFLDSARECAALTLPYLLTAEGQTSGGKLPIPWQSLGARGCNVLASKLMLGLFPVNQSFFKLSINDAELQAIPNVTPQIKAEVDLSLSKMEKIIMQQISESSDRVILNAAMKHLIVTGNVLLFSGKKNLKIYPLDRYVISRDGDGNATEIICVESIHRSLLPKEFQTISQDRDANAPGEDGPKFGTTGSTDIDDADVYTCAKLQDGQWKWHQEIDDKIVSGSHSSAPKNLSPWLPLRWNICDGEPYGRGKVEETIGDLKSLDGLTESLVSGSAASAKVVFTVAPSASLKPQSLARAQSGSIIVGRKDDVSVINVGKTADFRTVFEMIQDINKRLSESFLILTPRKSERTTAFEVDAVRSELNEQLSGVFGNLTTDLLAPYMARKLQQLQRSKKVPPLPKGVVQPIVVAGLNGVGRQADKASLMEFIQTAAQGLGPQAIAQYIDPAEFLKRLAASQGIDTLNLIKSPETMQGEKDEMKNDATQQTVMSQLGQLSKSPLAERLVNDIQAQQDQGQLNTGGGEAVEATR